MKKSWIFSILAMILLTACIFIPRDENLSSGMFKLTDMEGNYTTTFKSGDNFYMKFCLVNTTVDTQDYDLSNSGPAVKFYIYQDGQYITSSIDGFDFLSVIIPRKLAPGDTIQSSWLAPTPAHQSTINVLSPGNYEARIEFPHFETFETDTITVIDFTVTE